MVGQVRRACQQQVVEKTPWQCCCRAPKSRGQPQANNFPDCKGETPSWAGEKLETFFCLCVCIVLQTEEVSQIVVNSSVRARWTRDQ